MSVYNVVFTPTLLYSAESIALLDKQKIKITATEMKYLGKIIIRKWQDNVKNTAVRAYLKQERLVKRFERRAL